MLTWLLALSIARVDIVAVRAGVAALAAVKARAAEVGHAATGLVRRTIRHTLAIIRAGDGAQVSSHTVC